jgi:hypothetical protein
MKSYFEMKILKIPLKCLWHNGKVERLYLYLKTEAFNNVIPINLEHTIKSCNKYQKYYNCNRPHQGINGQLPGQKKNVVNFRLKFIEKSYLDKSITTFEIEKIVAA